MDSDKPSHYPDYHHFSVEEFASDPHFIQWVKTPQEETNLFWSQWLQQFPEKRAVIDEAATLVKEVSVTPQREAGAQMQKLWERIQQSNKSIQEETQAPTPTVMPENAEKKRSGAWPWIAVAASVCILMVAGIFLWGGWMDPITQYKTVFGQTKVLHLPDGSEVTLNANSELTLGDDWRTTREVWLKGEAFFAVTTKDKMSPQAKFTVHTKNVDVQVFGTQFTVMQRRGTRVVLNEGAIALTVHSGEYETIQMKPGEMVEIKPGNNVLIHTRVDEPNRYNDWKNHEWVLDDLTIDAVAERLTNTYGLPVEIKNNADSLRAISGVVPTDNLQILLKALSTAFQREFVLREDSIIVK